MGEFATLHLSGTDPNMAHSVYRASIPATDSTPASLSTHERHFCCMCGSALWAYDSRWPESIYPFATAIDTPTLPSVPIKDQIHIFTGFRKDYSPPIPANVEAVHCFGGYPDIGIAEWHKKHGRYGTFSPPSDS
ncbi:hypothetical protein BSLG_001423 [Batrachochytrium salamandrivorans]|nr:hypothetical protein BSLG_001423 [Batrachochytrium salamandrivorans]